MIAAASLLSASSAGLNSASKVRIALYVDDGSRGNGVLQWASFVAFSPQTEFSTITGEEVHTGGFILLAMGLKILLEHTLVQ